MNLDQYAWRWRSGIEVTDAEVADCQQLFGTHYGVWGAQGKHPGDAIRMSLGSIRRLLAPKDARIAMAFYGAHLVGYAISVQSDTALGRVSWVTQLVIHEQHRDKGIAKNLLASIWGFSNHFMWGMVTANPFAVRALEKATRRRCSIRTVAANLEFVEKFLSDCGVGYLRCDLHVDEVEKNCYADTQFHVSHESLQEKMTNVTTSQPWALGGIHEGTEWIAATFRSQNEFPLSREEMLRFLGSADSVAREAYGRMQLGSGEHRWAAYAGLEIDTIMSKANWQSGCDVLDVGCGNGRHSVELAKRGIRVTGVEQLSVLCEQALSAARMAGVDAIVRVTCGDARSVELGRQFDGVILLYDVIGSYADDESNEAILENAARHLRTGGVLVFSVMSWSYTWKRAKHTASMTSNPGALMKVKPSAIMETSGDVFDPDHYLCDDETHLVYRREQFGPGNGLPSELVVRDRRYTDDEVRRMVAKAGLRLVELSPVRAGKWQMPCEAGEGKELLAVARKL